MKINFLAGLGAVAVLSCASAASAANVSVTYQGVVDATQSNGLPTPDVDVVDLFGGGNLEGDNITALVNYDTTLGEETTDNATYDQLAGGLEFLTSSPITSEVFTINGYSYTFTPDYNATVYTQSGSGGYIQQIGYSTAGDSSIINLPTSSAPASLGTSFSATGLGFGYLLTAFNAQNQSDSIVFATTSAVVSAAPEPAAWLLMIVGLGLIGDVLRRAKPKGELAFN